jgi:hypothetical protein
VLQRVEMESASLMADVDSGEVKVPLSRAQAGRIATIRQKQKDAMQLADGKVRIATQVYDLVDSKIERLDTELKKLQREFEETPEIQTVPEAVVQSSSSSSMLTLQPQGALPDVPVDPNEPKYCICNRVCERHDEIIAHSSQGWLDHSQAPFYVIYMTYVYAMHTYAYMCDVQVSFGQMVACDNPDVRNKRWFTSLSPSLPLHHQMLLLLHTRS